MKIQRELTRNPYIDWIAIIATNLLLLIVLAIVGIYLYNAVVRGEIGTKSEVNAGSSKEFDKSNLSSVIKRFSSKEKESARAATEYSGYGDPSM